MFFIEYIGIEYIRFISNVLLLIDVCNLYAVKLTGPLRCKFITVTRVDGNVFSWGRGIQKIALLNDHIHYLTALKV